MKVAIVGGGPAGMCAALFAAKHHDVTLFERNDKLGKKLYLTGKGRCNITNVAEGVFLDNIPRNPKFLYSALKFFSNKDIIALLESLGVPTKVERGGRVFPVSDKSSDVLRALEKAVRAAGAKVRLNSHAECIEARDGKITGLRVGGELLAFDAVILATGGMSYPQTGSTGDGYAFAKNLGHTIVPLSPSLIPLETVESWPLKLCGLTLKNVTLRAYADAKKKVFEELGELLFTHFGVSGPLVLSASSRLAGIDGNHTLEIDLKPALNAEALDKRLLRDFSEHAHKQAAHALDLLLPKSLAPVVVNLANVPADKRIDQLTKAERQSLLSLLKALPLSIKQPRPIDEAVITRGGVATSEITPGCMRSKKVQNLYFAGEIIDVDGYTGGFNLQIAFSTGALAGSSV